MGGTQHSGVRRLIGWLPVLNSLISSCAAAGDAALDWPEHRALPVFPETASTIDVANITRVTPEERALLVSLQGVVNRNQPRIYVYWNDLELIPNPGDFAEEKNARRYWAEDLQDAGFTLTNLTSDPLQLLEKYHSEVTGAVIYDLDVPDTINLATTVAGIRSGVLATAELATRFDLPVLEDFRGRFADKFEVYEYGLSHVYPNVTNRIVTAIGPRTSFKRPNVTWTTLLEEDEPIRNRTNIGIYTVKIPPELLEKSSTIYVNFSDAITDTGYGPSVYHVTATLDNNQTLVDFATATDDEYGYLYFSDGSAIDDTPSEQRDDRTTGVWRYADGTSSWVYQFNVPSTSRTLSLALNMSGEFRVSATTDVPAEFIVNSWFRDYIVATSAAVVWLKPSLPREAVLLRRLVAQCAPNAAYLGWFPDGDEMPGVQLLAEAGVYVVAADFLTSGSLQAGLSSAYNDTAEAPQPPPPRGRAALPAQGRDRPQVRSPRPRIRQSTNSTSKIYLNIVWPEGDNIQYTQNRMREMWEDDARGEVPQGWTISPLLRDIAPNILAYYKTTATPNDFLITGPDGAGYTYPINWPGGEFAEYLDQTGTYMRDTGLEPLIWVYNRINKTDIPCSTIPDIIQGYEDAVGQGLSGIMCNFVPNDEGADPFADKRLAVNFTASGLPVSGIVGIDNDDQGVERLRNISVAWNSSLPLWITAAPSAFSMKPTNISNIVGQLGPEFEVLRPDVFYRRLRLASAQNST